MVSLSTFDDILIYAETVEQHDSLLRQVLKHLHAKDFQLQLRKCQFQKTELPFLGRILSANGVRPDLEHVGTVKEAPAPTNLK